MIKGKQRSYLKSLANTMNPIMQIGKGGVSETVLDQIDDLLEARELIKISILNNAGLDAKEVAVEVCEQLGAEYVQSMGSKIVIYRRSEENQKIQLPR
ncbi:RNA-binding protein [Andreesenia angusta]|uniref:RNA-binding protein n=1 Tax=Andreesenia angusta TaxID=39480 RepID=A0A1S1V7D7_9FIRM|nr:ribosome assembly RNA-binding protein YhbY [Andreesenia angusta]OHW62513.1 RNA-binding protein [Andreesenia angusta]